MNDLVEHIAPLALGAAVSPTILTMSVLILSKDHGRSRLAVFTLANLIVLTAIGLVGIATFKGTVHGSGDASTKAAAAAVDSALGLILLIFGVRAMLRPAPEKPQQDAAPDAGRQLGRYMLLGVVIMLSNFTTLALYLPADKEIAISDVDRVDKALVFAGLTIVATVTAWLPLLLVTVAPRPSRPILDAVNRFVTDKRKPITVAVCFAFGVYLLVKGLTG